MTRGLAVVLACGLWATVPVVLAVGCGGDDSGDDEHGDHGDHDDDHASEEGAPHDHDADIGPSTGATCPSGSTLTYDNFAKGFFTEYCNRCHSASVKGDARMLAPADHNFDDLAHIELLAKHIDQKAGSGPNATNISMPPSDPKPSEADRKKLSEWIACDLPED